MNKIIGYAGALILCAGASAHAAIIDFDPPSLIDVNAEPATYDEAGFRLSGELASFLPLDDIGTDGSQGLFVFANSTLTLTSLDGSLFDLLSIDFGANDGFGLGVEPGAQLTVSAAGNDALSQTLDLGTGGLTSFSFDDFIGLTAVDFIASADFALDNINAMATNDGGSNAVPAPASLALMGLGLVGMMFSRRRKLAKSKL